MAKSPLPDALARRHLLERELPPAQARRIAEAYLAEDRRLEAVDFLRAARAEASLEELRAQALRDGDAFLFRVVSGAAGRPPDRDEWLRLGETARALAKDRYAAEAERNAAAGAPKP